MSKEAYLMIVKSFQFVTTDELIMLHGPDEVQC